MLHNKRHFPSFILLSMFLISVGALHSSFKNAPSIRNTDCIALLNDTIPPSADVVTEADIMPRFPGCEDMEGTELELQACAQKKMLEYLYRNLYYPALAREYNIQGTVVISFVVDKKGIIKNAKIIQDIGEGCGEEALRVVNKMNTLEKKWTPGELNGEKVAVQYTLPVKFKLEKEQDEASSQAMNTAPPENPNAPEDVLIKVEQSPRFPGCEHLLTTVEKDACAQKKMLEHIYGNLKYPVKARENGIEGQVVIQFIVEKDGSITNINIVRDVKGGCGEAAYQAVKSMQDLPEKWTPGMQDGKLVRVKYTLPVKFKLEGGTGFKLKDLFRRKN